MYVCYSQLAKIIYNQGATIGTAKLPDIVKGIPSMKLHILGDIDKKT
jgi:hypothetical protein